MVMRSGLPELLAITPRTEVNHQLNKWIHCWTGDFNARETPNETQTISAMLFPTVRMVTEHLKFLA